MPENRTIGGSATLPRLITVQQAAEMLAVSGETVRNWIEKEAIPYLVLPQSGSRREFRIPLQGLLSCLSGNYNLADDLARLEAAAESAGDVDVLTKMGDRGRT